MKTILFSMFEGVAAKNLLRTGVVDALLEKEDVRVVLLMKNEERAKHYEKEFTHPRLTYEVVPYDRSLGKGLDRFFGWLKFQLIRTETTKIRRRTSYEEHRNPFLYTGATLLNIVLARPVFVRLFRYLDGKIVRNRTYQPLFDKYEPTLVFLAHLFEEPEIHILREARRRGVRSVGLINSWDKATARSVMRLIPDTLIVFNEYVKKEAMKYHLVPEDRIRVSGVPQYDAYQEPVTETREDFMQRMNFDPKKKLVVFAPFGRSFNSSMWLTVDMLHEMVKEGKFGNDVELLVRFQPNDFLEDEELEARPWLHYDYPGVRFSSERGVDWDMGPKEIEHLMSTLKHMDLLISYASSVTLDAMLYGKPVINIGFEVGEASPVVQPTRHYEFEHYQHVLETGAITFVESRDELAREAKRLLKDPKLNKEAQERLIEEQVEHFDGKSAERIARFVKEEL